MKYLLTFFAIWLFAISFLVWRIYERQTYGLANLQASLSNQDTVKSNQDKMQLNDSLITNKIDSLHIKQESAQDLLNLLNKSPK